MAIPDTPQTPPFKVGDWVVLTESFEVTTPEGQILLPAGLPGEVFTIGKPDYPNYGIVVGVRWHYMNMEMEIGTWVSKLMEINEYTAYKRSKLN